MITTAYCPYCEQPTSQHIEKSLKEITVICKKCGCLINREFIKKENPIKKPRNNGGIKRDALDILFSEFIRKRAVSRVGGCERCLKPYSWKDLQCSHFYGRGDKSTRFDESNGAGMCGGCHMFLEHHPLAHTEWFAQHLGKENFESLQSRHRITYPKPDKKALEIYYKAKLKELGGI